MHVLISSGETSGDRYGAMLIDHLRHRCSSMTISANGGEAMRGAGAHLLHHVVDKSTIGFIEPLRHIGYFLWVLWRTKRYILQQSVSLVVLIDHQGFNIPLAKWCRRHGVRIISLFAPQYWMWGKAHRAHAFVSMCDVVACVFQEEYHFYRAIDSTKSVWIGHPLHEALPTRCVDLNNRVLAVFPGSRRQEIQRLLPIMRDAVQQLQTAYPDIVVTVAISSSAMRSMIQRMMEHVDVEYTTDSRGLIARATCSMAASGTVVLEHGLMGTPCVVMYALSALSYWLVCKTVLPTIQERYDGYISLPNMLLRRPMFPELLQGALTPSAIVDALTPFLLNIKDVHADSQALRQCMGCDASPMASLAKLVCDHYPNNG